MADAQNDTPAHRKKREEWVDQEIAALKRGKMAQAEHALEVQARRIVHDQNEEDWMGIGANADQIRAFTENAVDDLEEHQYRQREEAQRRIEEGNRRAGAMWRRQDHYENRRRAVGRQLRNQLGREPTMDEFIAAIAHLQLDRNWSDDEQ